MHPVDAAFERSGGFLRRRDLLGLGMRDTTFRRLVRSGDLVRIRQGWYAVRGRPLPDGAAEAVRIGGRLTGLSALRSYGVWTPDSRAFEVAVPVNAKELRDSRDMHMRLRDSSRASRIRIHWVAEAPRLSGPVWRVGIGEALTQTFRTSTREEAVIVADSCLHLKLLRRRQLEPLLRALPSSRRAWLGAVDRRAESGGETASRLRLRTLGIRFEPQPVVPGVGRLDARIGHRTYLEVDGFEFHGTADAFEKDHARDLVSRIWDHQVVRITSKQVFADWPLCLQSIHAALATD